MSKQSFQGRPWTPHEDKLLTEAVCVHGDNTEKWKTIALCVPGRTNKACRKRWLHSLSPHVKKSAWTPEEDRQLLALFDKLPNKWSQIARGIPGRTDDACSKRYREALDPTLKKDDWTQEEDGRLRDIVARHTTDSSNPKWVLIGQELGRSSLGCRNRWRLLERKRNAAAREKRNQPMRFPQDPTMPRFLTEVWPPFAENDSGSFWAGAWDTLNFCAPTVNATENTGLLSVNTGGSDSSDVNAAPKTAYSLPSCTLGEQNVQSVSPMALVTFAASSSSLSSASSAAQNERHTMLAAEEFEGTEVHADDSVTLQSAELMDCQDDTVSANDDPRLIHDVDHSHAAFQKDVSTVVGTQSMFRISYTIANGSNSINHQELVSGATPNLDAPCLRPPVRDQSNCEVIHRSRKRRRSGDQAGPSIQIVTMTLSTGQEKKPPKLSSKLPVASDPSVLAYACGHSSCWPNESSESTVRFATSGELHNHFKDVHLDEANSGDETPFRCGLKDCKKAWKSINGLQYHLQVSKAHYQRALSSVAPTRLRMDIQEEPAEKTKRKQHKCPHPECPNSYKQLSGLRYHLLHGHPKHLPTQLDLVPPSVARRFGVEPESASL